MATVKKDAHQIGSAFRRDMHRIARADKFREEQAMDHRGARPETRAMGAGPAHAAAPSSRQARMDAAYADWQRTHR
ncbi:MAG TPA: hypothetical protein VHA82_02430 [Ramlibacter sp.]|uniref:hypothetical protein n=1 Tax=Ramlibacter sp. TaxID=1917967 RepID=UPI002B543C3B|nr:hypothetical protein [Ramlibacter sp.]HVZ42639.1 hypothetical protein [Ramlibacter sp.]